MKSQIITSLQNAINENHLDAYCLNSSDYHLSEYVPAYFRTIAYFSGFTGSVSTLIVDKEEAYIFVDGRYHIQADKQCLPNGVNVVKLGTKDALEPIDFIEKNYKGKVVGLDGRRTSIGFGKELTKRGIEIKSIDIYSSLIENRAELVKDKLVDLDIEYTGETRKQKLDKVKYCLEGKCSVISNLESIAYLLNLRGNDIIYTPVFMANLVFYKDYVYLFINLERLTESQISELYEDGVAIKNYDEFYSFLKEIKNEIVVLDENKVNYEAYTCLASRGNHIVNMFSIVEEMKSIKNEVEIANTIKAHIYDGVAMVKFLKWIDEADKTTLDELSVAKKLDSIRVGYKAFDLSFNSIVAYNANAAMCHYSATEDDFAKLDNKGILLVDSGGQYKEGTTDITRTFALGEVSDEVKKHFTLVLKSMFNLSSTKFLAGTTGQKIDIIARKDLWENGIDYMHGTGHGVGHVLSVHEGPPNIRYGDTLAGTEKMPFKPGHIVSDEPGVYFEGKYGIRCENLVVVEKDVKNEFGQFLRFKTLTLCPFDLRLIDKNYLDEKTINILNAYHKEVYDTLSPYLDEDEKEYLKKATRELE